MVAVTADVTSGGGGSGPDQMRITIYDLRRQGPFVVLDFGFVCVQASGDHCDISDLEPPGPAGITADGVSLVDPVAQKEYRAVVDSQGRPATSEVPTSA